MYELYQLWLEIRDQPIRWGSIAAVLLFLIDKFGRRLITSQVKRLFHAEDRSELRQYIANQQRIERKVDSIINHLGVPQCSPSEIGINGQTRKKPLLPYSLAEIHLGNQLKEMRRKMGNINKGILLPLLAAIATFLKQAFGVEVTDDQLDMYANLALFLLMLLGIFMNPKKPQQKEVVTIVTNNDPHDYTGLDAERESSV